MSSRSRAPQPPQRQRAAPPAAPAKAGPPEARRKKKGIPTVDLHLRIGLEDVLVRISAADYQKLVVNWMLGAEDVILRGPFRGMETDIIIRGGDGGMVSVRPRDPENPVRPPAFKLVLAAEARKEFLAKQGF